MKAQALGRVQDSGSAMADAVLAAVGSVLGPTDKTVPLHEPEFAGREWDYVKECIDTGWVSSVGSYVDRFERDLAAYTGAKHVVATVNGTAALHLCLKLVGVEPGDEVVIPTLTFVATANAVAYCGAVPHFADVSLPALGIDPRKLDRHLADILETRGGRKVNRQTGRPVSAVIVMHTFGHPAEIERLAEVCDGAGLPLIEDAAESLGSTWRGRHCGTFGAVAALSFNGNKVVTTGGGGAVMTADAEVGRRAKHLSTTAKLPHPWLYAHDEVGYNYRLPNINAALGCAQLECLEARVAEKRRLAAAYDAAFAGSNRISFLREPAGSRSNYWLAAILLDPAENLRSRDAVLERLNAAGYTARPTWTLMHKLVPYANCPRAADLSTAETVERTLINLPSSPRLGRNLA
ncbi:MAG: LegC family aminotransferase [Xanthobacteraceae bacterium]